MSCLKSFFGRVCAALFFTACFLIPHYKLSAQARVKKIVLQAFWWDYWNSNFPNSWANYLTELAPRLKTMGFDAVWIPPSYKNGGSNSVGYSPFDHYDLGEKYQKPEAYWTNLGRATTTRVGTKDELLRMIAVLHANGIEVVQDLVLNHVDNAGSGTGAGGQDPEATYSTTSNSGYKNFRYVSYLTPFTDDSEADYWKRSGRWSKNFTNFHPNANHNSTNDDMTASYWGPDICYGKDCPVGNSGTYYINNDCNVAGGFGQSSNVTGYNPSQQPNYMQDEARNWIGWLKKQTGVDGFRWDAVKHFDVHTQQDLSWNLRYGLPDFAKGGDGMINVGEFVGNKDELDRYTNIIYQANGGNNFLMGAFDFGLRAFNGGLKSVIDGSGSFDMSSLPGSQQNNRFTDISGNRYHRTMPFVNNHDTYRPTLDASGNITGWNTGSELSPHILPDDVRLPLTYAIILSMDGNPQIFFEDIFNLYNTGKRYSHLPENTTDLPINSAIEKLIWAHQVLDFKNGDYKVRTAESSVFFNSGSAASDLLVIERSGKAVIGLNDNGSNWQSAWIDTDFMPGTVVKDYSGANGDFTYTVDNSKRINVNTPPVNPSSGYFGYSIWAPIGFDNLDYTTPRAAITTQEFEMANDLGDSHCNSLGYGGALPANTTNQRIAGKIFVAEGKPINYKVFPEIDNTQLTIFLCKSNGNVLATATAAAAGNNPLVVNYTPNFTGWVTIKIRNANNTQPAQKAWCQLSYTAPTVVNTRLAADNPKNTTSIWTGNKNTQDIIECGNWEEGKVPDEGTDVLIPAYSSPSPVFTVPQSVKNLVIENGATITLQENLYVKGNITNLGGTIVGTGKIVMNGSAMQEITSTTSLPNVVINNTAGVVIKNDLAISGTLELSAGNLLLENNNLTIEASASIVGGNAASFIKMNNYANETGSISLLINSQSRLVPIGNSTYTPVTLDNSGTAQMFTIKGFDAVLQNGLSGNEISGESYVKHTWSITPATNSSINASIQVQWNVEDETAGFDRSSINISHNSAETTNGSWEEVSDVTAVGNNPYMAAVTNVNSFSQFAVFERAIILPFSTIEFEAKKYGNGNKLFWKTGDLNELNNIAEFIVEKSANGIHFKAIASVGVTNANSYTFTDNSSTAYTTAHYRIVCVNKDGSKRVSKIVIIKNATNRTLYFDVYPSPSKGNVEVRTNLKDDEMAKMVLTNAGGIQLSKWQNNIAYCTKQVKQKLSRLGSGIYIISIQLEKTFISKKIILL